MGKINIEKIASQDSVHKIITFPVLVPDEKDFNWDIISQDEIVKTAINFALSLGTKQINFDHQDGTDTTEARFVETYILPIDMVMEGGILPKGTWMVWIQFSETLYQKFIDGEIVGVSMEGWGTVDPIN